jgi:hypothetical protein
MSTQLDTTALTAVLKQKYTQRKFNLLCYKKNPFYALVNKITDFGGKNKVVAMRNASPQGRGPTIAVAQGNKTASAYNAFVVTRISDYATASITGEAIKAAKGDENTLIEGLTKEIDGSIHTCMRNLAICMFRNGGGQRGQIAANSTISSTTINLNNIGDVVNFENGMTVCLAGDDGYNNGGSLLGLRGNGGTTLTITGVDRDLGTLTASAAWNTIAAAATLDSIFQTAAGVGSDYNSMIRGLAAWLPATAPGTSDNFFGVNRSQDVTRLGGIRVAGNGADYQDTLVDAATRISREGGMADHVFVNPLDWAKLVKALGAKVIYDRASPVDMPEVGFKAVQLEGPDGPVKVIADLNCPLGTAYMVQLDTLNMESLGEAPMILDFDGNTILRNATADTYDVRIGYYGNLTCEAPGWNAVISF